jgi:sulfoxide reductase heme-binding subunit YedZ
MRTKDRLAYAALTALCFAPLALAMARVGAWDLLGQDRWVTLTGLWAMRLLVLALAITPVARTLRQRWMIRFRRVIGLTAFAYTCLHLVSYVVVDQVWRAPLMLVTRFYLLLGTVAFVLLIPMAATSSNRAARKIGGDAWKRLHRAIYLAAPLAAAHFLLASNGVPAEGVIEAVLIVGLLAARLVRRRSSVRRV